MLRYCTTATERAHFLGAVNTLRRNSDTSWHGDHLDGQGFVDGIRAAGGNPDRQRALLVGAGGAGTAIAHALLEAGVSQLAIHDQDSARRNALLARLHTQFADRVIVGSTDPSGFDLVVNATPAGMRPGDALPIQVDRLRRAMFVGDVITSPELTPMLLAARERQCATLTGVGMFNAVAVLMLDFLTHRRSSSL